MHEGRQRLDKNRCLDGHMQAADDTGILQRLGLAVFLAKRHQAGHLGFGDGNFLAAPFDQGHICNFVVVLGAHLRAPVISVEFFKVGYRALPSIRPTIFKSQTGWV